MAIPCCTKHDLRIFYINLDDAAERRQRMERMLHTMCDGVHWERWRASDLSTPWCSSQTIALTVNPKGTCGSVRDEAELERTLRCFKSHVDLLSHIQNLKSADWFLILEDDVILQPGWRDALQDQIEKVPSDWDMVLAGWWNACRSIDQCSETCFQARGPTFQVYEGRGLYFYAGQHGYLVRVGAHLDRLLTALQAQSIRHIDEMRCWGQKGLRTYALKSRVVGEDPATVRCSTRIQNEPISTFYVGRIPLQWTSQRFSAFVQQFAFVQNACVREPPAADYRSKYGFVEVKRSVANSVAHSLRNEGMVCRLKTEPLTAKPLRPPAVVQSLPKRLGRRGPLPGRMCMIGNAGRGRRPGSKNKPKLGRPSKVRLASVVKKLAAEVIAKLERGVGPVQLPLISSGGASIKSRFGCGSEKAGKAYHRAQQLLKSKGICTRRVPGRSRQQEFFVPLTVSDPVLSAGIC